MYPVILMDVEISIHLKDPKVIDDSVLAMLQQNEAHIAVADEKISPLVIYNHAVSQGITATITNDNTFVAVKNGEESKMEYDTAFDAYIYAWAKHNGHCD